MKHHDNGMCLSCGGVVGPDGLAPLGEAEEFENFEGSDTDQHEAGERMRAEANGGGFAAAVRRRGYADGGEVDDYSDFEKEMMKSTDGLDDIMGPTETLQRTNDEMKRRGSSSDVDDVYGPSETLRRTGEEMNRRRQGYAEGGKVQTQEERERPTLRSMQTPEFRGMDPWEGGQQSADAKIRAYELEQRKKRAQLMAGRGTSSSAVGSK